MQSRTTFSLEQINAFRLLAQTAARPDRSGPEGWTISNVDPMKIVALFNPALWLKAGWTLHAYQLRDSPSGGNGNGVIWALPGKSWFPEPGSPTVLWGRRKFLEPSAHLTLPIPKPPNAIEDFREVIEGNGTPLSYALASILARELYEFGAMWHGLSWSDVDLTGETEVVVHDLGVTVTLETSGGRPIDHYKKGSYVYSTDMTDYYGSCVIH